MIATPSQIADYYERHRFDLPREMACPECHGAGFFYSDNGPAPREYDCDYCGGECVIEEDDYA